MVDWEVEERENLEMIGVADEDELKGIDTGSYIFTLRAVLLLLIFSYFFQFSRLGLFVILFYVSRRCSL